MIVGELIGFIVLCMFWIFFMIGVLGLNYEFRQSYYDENPSMIALYLVFAIFGLCFGIVLLVWYFNITGIGEILANMFKGWWNTRL